MVRFWNVLTNLAYPVAGVAAGLLVGPRPTMLVFVAGTIVLCYTSSVYHATVERGRPNSARAQRYADVSGIYFALAPVAAYGLAVVLPIPDTYLAIAAFVTWGVLTAFVGRLDSFKVVAVMGGILVVCMAVVAVEAASVRMAVPLAAIGAALLAWKWDRPGPSYLHAFWHVLSAAAMFACVWALSA